MRQGQTLPMLWLISDARNDAGLVQTLNALPRGSGFVYRHYHLPPTQRIARYRQLAACAKRNQHTIILADSAMTAREWGADGIYGPARALHHHPDFLRIATAHSLAEIGNANRARADAVMLSPVFTTRSHPDVAPLGPARFHHLATRAQMPVIALGGMTRHNAARLQWPSWAAIDGLTIR